MIVVTVAVLVVAFSGAAFAAVEYGTAGDDTLLGTVQSDALYLTGDPLLAGILVY